MLNIEHYSKTYPGGHKAVRQEGYTPAQIAKIIQEMNK